MNEVSTEKITAEKITAPKLLAFLGMLFALAFGIAYFYNPAGLNILWGILCLVIAFLIFASLELIDLGPVKIPYYWWLMLIFAAVLMLFQFFYPVYNYFPAILLGMAALIELIMEKKSWEASKMVTLVGIGVSIYECVLLFLGGNIISIINAVFGLILLVILLLIIFDLVDFKVLDYSWWFVLLVGFVVFTWVSPLAGLAASYGGTILLIAFLLILLAL